SIVDSEQEATWTVQKRIQGTEFSTYSLAIHGELAAHTCYESVLRAGLGAGIAFRTVRNNVLENFVSGFVKHANFHGQIGFDIIQDEQRNTWVIECNPRCTSGLHLFKKDGNLANLFAKTFSSSDTAHNESSAGIASEILRSPENLWAHVEFASSFWGLVDAWNRRRWGALVRTLISGRPVVTSMMDPGPTLMLPRTLWSLWSRSRTHRCSIQQATTVDMQWDGQAIS
ncbi:MAG: hypothetical protein AAFP90_00960, partial [Planctomycetota bacterium]